LEQLGHRVSAVDLPIEDPDAGAGEYADEISAAVTDPDTIVVAHSMMGLALPLVPWRVEVAGLAFLCAFLPEPGASFNELRERERMEPDRELHHVQFTDRGKGVWMVGPDTANELFYHDVPADISTWAISKLRPQSYRITREKTPLSAWPEVPGSYILCRDDRAVDPIWAREAADRKLGVKAFELDGGHSPFLTRPGQLAGVLDAIASGDRQAN
jgi:hypothetical protein